MPIKVSCPNPACRRTLNLNDKFAGKKIRCPQCRTVISVPGAPVADAAGAKPVVPAGGPSAGADERAAEQAAVPHPYHPARQVCTNCGAVLGVRDAICPSCGGDVRSGVTVMRITADQKKKAGLFGILPWMRTKKRGRRRRSGGRLLAVLLVLILIGGAVLGVLYLRKSGGAASSPPEAQATEQPAPGTT